MYTDEAFRAKNAALDGTLDTLRAIRCAGLWPRDQSYYSRNNWAGRIRLDDTQVFDAPFNNAFAHWLNLLCFLGGPELRDSAHTKCSMDINCALGVVTTVVMPSEQFNVTTHFNGSLAARYERRIRLFCPTYDKLHGMIVPLLQGLPEQATFLSAGAGTGNEILTLGHHFPGWRFVAVDVSPEMLNACRQRVVEAKMTNRVGFFNGRLQDYQSATTFDGASSIFVAHFIKARSEKIGYFRSIAANLKPGGLLLLADLFGDRKSREFSRLLDAWLVSYSSHGVPAEELAQDREVDPENWTGRIVNPNSGERSPCQKSDVYTVPSSKPKSGLMP